MALLIFHFAINAIRLAYMIAAGGTLADVDFSSTGE
jgi:hypothetical protein